MNVNSLPSMVPPRQLGKLARRDPWTRKGAATKLDWTKPREEHREQENHLEGKRQRLVRGRRRQEQRGLRGDAAWENLQAMDWGRGGAAMGQGRREGRGRASGTAGLSCRWAGEGLHFSPFTSLASSFHVGAKAMQWPHQEAKNSTAQALLEPSTVGRTVSASSSVSGSEDE